MTQLWLQQQQSTHSVPRSFGHYGYNVQQSHCRAIWKLLGTPRQWFDLSSSGYCGCLYCVTPQDQDLTTHLDLLPAYLQGQKAGRRQPSEEQPLCTIVIHFEWV